MHLPSQVRAPLLDDAEVAALLQAASRQRPAASRRPPKQGRSGKLLADMSGSGSDFAEVRAYHPGDDPRRIDWRASARSQTTLTRTYHPELMRPLCLVIDRSASMRFGTQVRLKATQALRWALWLAAGAMREEREVSALLIDAPLHWMPPQRGMAALENLLQRANRACPPITDDGEDAWTQVLTTLHRRLPAGAEVVLLSDFNRLGGEHDIALRQLGRHCDARALHIIDPIEQALPAAASTLQLCWGGRHLDVFSTDRSQDELTCQLRHWRERLRQRFLLAGMDYRAIASNEQALDYPGEPV